MAGIEQKQYSTGDAWSIYLSDANGWIDVTSAFQLKLYAKVSGGATIGPVIPTITTVQTFTGTLASGSNVITAVSVFTGITKTSTLTHADIPIGTTVVSFDSVGGTITMSNPAIANASAVSIKANVGLATYTPTSTDVSATGAFGAETAIHWDNTGTSITIVPSKAASNPTITIDANLTGAAE